MIDVWRHLWMSPHLEVRWRRGRNMRPGRRRWIWRRRPWATPRSSTSSRWSWWARWSHRDRLERASRLCWSRMRPRRWWQSCLMGCRSGSGSNLWSGWTGSRKQGENNFLFERQFFELIIFPSFFRSRF